MAQQLHYHVLDMEAMAAQLTADSLLTDMTHPGPDFMIQVEPFFSSYYQCFRDSPWVSWTC